MRRGKANSKQGGRLDDFIVTQILSNGAVWGIVALIGLIWALPAPWHLLAMAATATAILVAAIRLVRWLLAPPPGARPAPRPMPPMEHAAPVSAPDPLREPQQIAVRILHQELPHRHRA